MKKFVYLTLAIFLMSTVPAVVYANKNMESMSISEKVEKKMKKLTNELKLTEEQAGQVKALLVVTLTKEEAIRAGQKRKLEAVKKDSFAQIQSVLTDNQKTKYAEIDKEWEKKDKKSGCK